jgi:hypothetical protein
MQNSSRDFICNNGTFFSIHTGKEFSIINYFGLQIINHPEKYYSPEIGTIKNGKSDIRIGLYEEKMMGQVKQELNLCKNKDGKSLLEIYPAVKNKN